MRLFIRRTWRYMRMSRMWRWWWMLLKRRMWTMCRTRRKTRTRKSVTSRRSRRIVMSLRTPGRRICTRTSRLAVVRLLITRLLIAFLLPSRSRAFLLARWWIMTILSCHTCRRRTVFLTELPIRRIQPRCALTDRRRTRPLFFICTLMFIKWRTTVRKFRGITWRTSLLRRVRIIVRRVLLLSLSRRTWRMRRRVRIMFAQLAR